MSFLSTSAGAESILPEEYASLVIDPVTAGSIAFHPDVATTVTTSAHEFRIPILKEDAGAEWVREGDEISPDSPVLDEIAVTPAKAAGLTIISRELARDSSPAAQELVGKSLARSIIQKIDQAFLGSLPAPAPAGLGSIAATASQVIVADDFRQSGREPFSAAVSLAEQRGANITAFIVHPDDALSLAQMTDSDGSRRALLDDPRRVLDRPVLVNAAATKGTIWAVDSTRIYTVLREGTTIAVSDAPFFTSDRIAVRATLRVGFGLPNPAALVQIKHSTVAP